MTVPSSHDLPGPSGPRVLWTRDFVLLLGSAVLLWCSFYLQLTTLPVYIVQDLGGSSTQVGLLSTLLSLAAMVVRPIAGSALDRFGRRPVHLGTLLVFCFFTAAHGVPGGLAALFAVRVVHGFPFGAVTTSMHTVTADLVPEARRGEGIGYAGLPGTVATAIAPSVALSLLNNGSFSLVVWAATGLCIAAWLLALGIRHPQVHDPTARPSLAALLEPRVGRLSWVSGLMLIGYGGVISFVTLYAEQLGISQSGWFFSVYALGSLASRPIAGPLFDRRGPRLLVLGSLAVLLVSYLSLGRCTGEIAFLSAGFLMGLGLTSLVLALQTMAVNVVPPARRGAANATLFSAVDLGIGFGSFALGALADAAGSYGVMFTFAAGLLLIPAAMFFLWVLPSYERQRVE